jgi:hypothetical protein
VNREKGTAASKDAAVFFCARGLRDLVEQLGDLIKDATGP